MTYLDVQKHDKLYYTSNTYARVVEVREKSGMEYEKERFING